MRNSKLSFTRALALARYNWPLYGVAVISAFVGVFLLLNSISLPVRVLGGLGALTAAWFAAASFLAFHTMFDCSSFLSGNWLPSLLPRTPKRWVQVSVCLEETTLPMTSLFPQAEGVLFDLFSPNVMTEPAVTRARSTCKRQDAVAATPTSLEVADRWADVTVITLAAHEVRDRNLRESLFRELNRITVVDGRVVVVEHLRNLNAFLAFGPGFSHFLPRREWLRLASQAGLQFLSEFSMTPFIHVFVFATPADVFESQ